MNKIKTFLVCSGLGYINRGYESFIRECFDTIKNENDLDAYLFKSRGDQTLSEYSIPSLFRFGKVAKWMYKFFKIDGYTVEQITFFCSLIPYLIIKKPDVILLSDFQLSTYLWHLRDKLHLKYKIIFSNGAPNGPPFDRCDHVHQLLNVHYDWSLKSGASPYNQTVLPYGVNLPSRDLLSQERKIELKNELGIPKDTLVILSVGAVNKYHKRMDYLVKEFAKVDHKKCYLIILGQIDIEGKEVIELADKLLPKNSFIITSTTIENVGKYYCCADLFVLCSLTEGFGKVFIEAMSYGLPVVAHTEPSIMEVVGKFGRYLDMREPNTLAHFFKDFFSNNTISKEDQIEYVQEKYSWVSLGLLYAKMIKSVANS